MQLSLRVVVQKNDSFRHTHTPMEIETFQIYHVNEIRARERERKRMKRALGIIAV